MRTVHCNCPTFASLLHRARLCLGSSCAVDSYLPLVSMSVLLLSCHLGAMQGLFHPARKVRETYWRLYNSVYIGAEDSLIAAYPRLQGEENNNYSRPELDIFV